VNASVIIASYNYGAYLAEAIESAAAQTVPPHEIIVVDDGSSDDSVSVARRYSVTVIERQHEGAQRAMEAGIQASSGECFMLLGADDRVAGNYLEKALPFLEHDSDVGLVYTSETLFGSVHDFIPARQFSHARLLAANYVHGSAVIRRSAYDGTPGLATAPLAVYEDWYMVLDIVSNGWTAARTNDTTLYYRQHGMSRNKTGGAEHEASIRAVITGHPQLYRPSAKMWYWLHRHLYRHQPQAYTALALLACKAQGRADC